MPAAARRARWAANGEGLAPPIDSRADIRARSPYPSSLSVPAGYMRERWGEHLYGQYGFLDAFNPTFNFDVPLRHGRNVPGFGWVAGDYVGINQGASLAMIENYRSALIWRVTRKNPYVRRGLEQAGFQGGWLTSAP